MAGFQARLFALEGAHFRTEDQYATQRHLEKLVAEGKLPSSSLVESSSLATSSSPAQSFASDPLRSIKRRPASEVVYQHVSNGLPARVPLMEEGWNLGTQVSLGRGRFVGHDASIFSVAKGKEFAQLPAKLPTNYEVIRQRRISQAALESPVVQGLRLLPEFTPGRAFFWGTVLAVWGTAAVTVTTCRHLGIQKAEDVPAVAESFVAPTRDYLRSSLQPLKSLVPAASTLQESWMADFSRRIRVKLSGAAESHR
ncbi:hypothetical protein WJX74_004194 [Apatococcus lobatus]|uniref:Transmembrane protein n=1 Tax=Apatococcus lobatus TaxID=904363 RepID=A0AAW1S9W7_9CHLO